MIDYEELGIPKNPFLRKMCTNGDHSAGKVRWRFGKGFGLCNIKRAFLKRKPFGI